MINPLRLEIPAEISTERLLLRTPRIGDGEIVNDTVIASLRELKPWLPWATDRYTLGDAEDWCRRAASRFILGEEASYLIFDRATAGHIGNISSFSKDWRVPRFEIGYWLATAATGQGYMHEALAAVTRMTFANLLAERIEIQADEQNPRSRRVAERGGYELEGILKNDSRDAAGNLRNTCLYGKIRESAR